MDPIRSLEARIERLERRCRRLRLASTAGAAALVAAGLAAAWTAPPGVLRAERFELVGREGRVLGTWSADAKNVALRLSAPEGGLQVALQAGRRTTSAARVTFHTEDGLFREGQLEWIPAGEEPYAGVAVERWRDDAPPLLVQLGVRNLDAGLAVSCGETLAHLLAGEAIASLHMEGGEDAFGAVNARASEGGAFLGASWNDELSSVLGASPSWTGLAAGEDEDDEEGEPKTAIELVLDEAHRPALRLRDGEDVLFRAP